MPNYNQTLQTNNSSLEEIITQLNNLPDAGEQATPTISVNNSNGLITATAGTKSSTYQMAFQPAQTITPGTTNKTIAANTYLGGVQTIKGDANLVASNIVSGKSIFGVVGTATTGGSNDPFAVPFTYTVDAISGATYGFALNSAGYYESQNKGQHNSYAICRVNLKVNSVCDIVFDVINYAEGNYDYALFGNIDSALALSYTADSSVKQSFKGKQSASVVNVTYSSVSAGNHFIDIKFIKDSSQHSNYDSVQFKIQATELSQETINKIIAADPDLTASNIKSGVDIFGVVGTYEGAGGGGGGGDTSAEDGLITKTLTTYANDRVENIGRFVFDSCGSLTSVNFPVCTSIGSYAFRYCINLTSVSFPKVTTIGEAAFFSCGSLTSVNFPVCTSIGSSAFYHCSSLTSVSFSACTNIGGYAFVDCSRLTSVSFPKVTTIGYYAFAWCSRLTSVSFPACTTISYNAFAPCSSLTNVSFPKVTTIGNNAFSSCGSLTSVNFPVCTIIGGSAFANCSRLTSVSFPACTNIGADAFARCSSLTNVSFPKVTTIDAYAFAACSRLISIYLGASTVCALFHSSAFSQTGIWSNKGSIFVPASLLASYKTATNWAYFSNRIYSYNFT